MDSLESIVNSIEGILSGAALIGLLILIPLYLSQRRDVARLREWMEREPEHPAVDAIASDAILDRAEAELEELLAQRGEAPDATAIQPPPATPLPPARRVTSERPALERVTMERAALAPHPRWRQLAARLNQPRYLAAIAVAAVAIAGAAILASEELLQSDGDGGGPRPGAVVPGEVTVAVLNGTSIPGLAGKVGDDIESNGYDLGDVGTSERQLQQTVVMFEPGQEREARRTARDLGVTAVQPIDESTRRLSGGADVVVIAGQDRAI